MKNNLDKVLKVFSLMWLITGLGFGIGFFIPVIVMIPLGILAIVLLIVSYFTKGDSPLTKLLVMSVPLIMGIISNVLLTFYFAELGMGLFTTVVVTAIVLFIVMGMLGYQIQKDLSFMGKFLFIALLGLIIVGVIVIFTGASNLIMAILAGLGVLIFLGYTMYDFNQIAQRGVTDDEIYHTALSLYLDLFNLIMDLLRLVYYLKEMIED